MFKILAQKSRTGTCSKSILKAIVTSSMLLASSLGLAAESPWKGSEMTLEFYKRFVAEENCGEASRDYLACVYSVRALLKSIDPNLDIETQTTAPESGSKVLMNANNLVIVKKNGASDLPKKNLSLQEVFQRNEKFKYDFKNKFNPAYYHYRVTSQFVITELIRFIEKNYKKKLSEEQIATALNEYFHIASDPHSDFRLKKELVKDSQSASSDFVGIGVGINQTQGSLLIQNVFEGSGAEAAGMEPGDIILAVGTKRVNGENLEEVMSGLRGTEGTQVKVQIQREQQILDLTITRKRVVIKVVTPRMLDPQMTPDQRKIGYIGYSNFVYGSGCQEIETALNTFNQNRVDGAILDLRSNGGGRVDIANCIAGLFLGPDKVVAHLEENSPTGKSIETIVTTKEQVFSKPLVVLIDAHSASASELLAGALRDHNRAYIVGQTSFGKGSSQSPVTETTDMLFYATNGLFYQPSGKTNQTIGIKPHVESFKGILASPNEQFAMREKDIYMFPLQPKQLNVTYDTTGFDQLVVPAQCIANKNTQTIFSGLAKKSFHKDMQVLTGAALISCL